MMPIQTHALPNETHVIVVYKSGYTSIKHCCPFNGIVYTANKFHKKKQKKTKASLPVRNPIERFCSAVNYLSKNKKYADYTVDVWLDHLEQNTHMNLHFMDVTTVLRNACFCFDDIYLYKFPDHFEQMLRDGGYEGEVPHENASVKKIVLTESQSVRVDKYYARDIALFKSIKEPGQQFDFMPM